MQLSDFNKFKAVPFPADHPTNVVRLYSPQDQVHGALVLLLSNVTQSLRVSMYGEDDPELTDLIVKAANDPAIFVQINLDKTQAGGAAEVPLVAKLEACPNTRVAVGMSAAHKINHLKMAVVDGFYTLTGSTNWSADGEGKQNNESSIFMDRAIAAEATVILDTEHQVMLSQMAKAQP